MRLTPGTGAPEFSAESVAGRSVSLQNLRGDSVLLKFYRFAECPICNLHLRELIRRYDEVRAAGLTAVVFIHSPHETVEREQGLELPFELIPDPDKRIFDAYGVERSTRGMFSARVARDYGRALRAGLGSRPVGHHGGITGHPADFILDPGGVIRYARYGADYADTLGVDKVLELATPDLALTT